MTELDPLLYAVAAFYILAGSGIAIIAHFCDTKEERHKHKMRRKQRCPRNKYKNNDCSNCIYDEDVCLEDDQFWDDFENRDENGFHYY